MGSHFTWYVTVGSLVGDWAGVPVGAAVGMQSNDCSQSQHTQTVSQSVSQGETRRDEKCRCAKSVGEVISYRAGTPVIGVLDGILAF